MFHCCLVVIKLSGLDGEHFALPRLCDNFCSNYFINVKNVNATG